MVGPARNRLRLLVVTALAALLTTGAASRAGAQVVTGTLVRQDTDQPLPGATVVLMTEAAAPVDSTRSDADGRFRLRAPAPGRYRLYFDQAGYTSITSEAFAVARGAAVERRFEVPLISGQALQRVSETIDLEKRLQGNLTEFCGERPRSWEAGLLVGTVRDAATAEPLAGAVVRVEAPAAPGAEPFRRSTLTSANGVYVVCNVPAGRATMRVELDGYRPDIGPVEAHAGDVGWYDVDLRARTPVATAESHEPRREVEPRREIESRKPEALPALAWLA